MTVSYAIATWLIVVRPVLSQHAGPTPILTVCEALRDLKLYNGKDVVIVGRSGSKFEGTFLSENCEPDGRTRVQSMIYVDQTCQVTDSAPMGQFPPTLFPVQNTTYPSIDESCLRQSRGVSS